jgi:hypothetical protein
LPSAPDLERDLRQTISCGLLSPICFVVSLSVQSVRRPGRNLHFHETFDD